MKARVMIVEDREMISGAFLGDVPALGQFVDHQVVAPPLRGRDDHAVAFAQPEEGIQRVHDFGAVPDDRGGCRIAVRPDQRGVALVMRELLLAEAKREVLHLAACGSAVRSRTS